MSSALINLVRLNTQDETSPDHDYTDGELFERHEEIKLVDPNGEPCAIPMPSAVEDIDYKYNYITGNRGHQTRMLRRNLTINVDFLDNDICRRLELWQAQRARVLVAPNMGRNTLFSYRPVNMTGTTYTIGGTAYDLTGNHAVQFTQSANTVLMWDEKRRMFQKKSVSDSLPMFHTEGGAAVGAPRSVRNLMDPVYPTGAGSGTLSGGASNSGWTKSGTDAADLTFTYNSGAFGHPDCPDTITVAYSNITSASRTIEIKGLFDPLSGDYGGITPTGSGDMAICPWVRGQFPDGAAIFLVGSTGITTMDLSGKRFDGWTPLPISRYEADWSLSVPNYFINLPSTLGVAGSFEIGPTMVTQYPSTQYNAGPYWTGSSSLSGYNNISTVSALPFPAQGTAICSFTLPDDWGNDYSSDMYHSLIGSSSIVVRVGKSMSGTQFVRVADSISGGGETLYPSGASALVPGKINTVAFTWNGDKQSVYCNGAFVGDISMASNKINFGASSLSPLYIGYDSGSRTMFPALLLSARIDEGAMTADDVANVHLALTDPVALQFAMYQRGRVYQIKSIPQTVRASQGGSHVIGSITLEQVQLQHWLTDPMNPEETVL